jgi:hypothetical protein
MDLLELAPAYDYDIVLSDALIEILYCTHAYADTYSECRHWNDTIGALSNDDLENLHRALGHETPRGAPSARKPGTILFLVLVKSPRLPWDLRLAGKTTFVYWADYDPLQWHWTNTACTGWALQDVPTVAHELGHCFGLDHNGAADINFDGHDNTIDLMYAYSSRSTPTDLKPSNAQRIKQHFRDTGGSIGIVREVPLSHTFD